MNLISDAKPTEISIDQYQIEIAVNNLVSDDERNTFKKLFNIVFDADPELLKRDALSN